MNFYKIASKIKKRILKNLGINVNKKSIPINELSVRKGIGFILTRVLANEVSKEFSQKSRR